MSTTAPRPVFPLAALDHLEVQAVTDNLRVSLARVTSGVVAGRMSQHGHGSVVQAWTLFTSHDQFVACAANDDLRFADPLTFRRIATLIDSAFGKG